MAISVRLDQQTERIVSKLAKQSGQTKSEVLRTAIQVLARTSNAEREAERPYERISDLIGCATGGPPNSSERTGQGLRDLLAKRGPRR